MATTSGRRRTRARRSAGGAVRLRLVGCSTSRLGVFTLLLLLFTRVAGVDLLRRVFTVCRVQPEPLLRLGDTVVIYLRGEDAGVGVVGDRRSPPDDSRPRRLQLRVGLLPPGSQLIQAQTGIPGLDELQRPPGAGLSRRGLLGFEAADCHLQPVSSPTGGAGNHFARPEGGQHLRPGTLKPVEQSMSRLEAGLDRQELLLQRTTSGWQNLEASLPSCLVAGLDDLVGGDRVAGEVL